MNAYCEKCKQMFVREFFPNTFFCEKCRIEETKKIEGKICPQHKSQLYFVYVNGESGGFVDDYIACFEKDCLYREPFPKNCYGSGIH